MEWSFSLLKELAGANSALAGVGLVQLPQGNCQHVGTDLPLHSGLAVIKWQLPLIPLKAPCLIHLHHLTPEVILYPKQGEQRPSMHPTSTRDKAQKKISITPNSESS